MGKSPVLSGGTHLHNLSWREERISQIAILHCTTLQEGTPVPCSVGIHCDIRLLLPLGKCDILLVPGLTDQLWGQAPSHFLGGLSATYILPLATLWLWHVGTFHEGSQASEGFPDPPGILIQEEIQLNHLLCLTIGDSFLLHSM